MAGTPQNTKIPNFLATVILSHFLLPAVSQLKYSKFLGAYNNKAKLCKEKTEAVVKIHSLGFAKK
jgi:hypothetical protein